jgi:hypothetical protein
VEGEEANYLDRGMGLTLKDIIYRKFRAAEQAELLPNSQTQ